VDPVEPGLAQTGAVLFSALMPPSSGPPRMLLAPGASAGALRMPAARAPLPPVDANLVRPETREEIVRGRRVLAMPANPPHADRHCELDFVIRGHVAQGYVGSTDLLTRASAQSNFATDTCIRKVGEDPRTDARHLEELAFEVVNEQSLADVTDRAEDLIARGVRRVFAVFVKRGEVSEWRSGAWHALDLAAEIADVCLVRPIAVKALLVAAEADNAVARALVDKQNPVLMALKTESKAEGLGEGTATAIVAVLTARGVALSEDLRDRILSCSDLTRLNRWLARAAVASSATEVFEGS
jgi:hypothetical protein